MFYDSGMLRLEDLSTLNSDQPGIIFSLNSLQSKPLYESSLKNCGNSKGSGGNSKGSVGSSRSGNGSNSNGGNSNGQQQQQHGG
jgi:hypothetical protein